ncbi:alpha-tocopherol transfer protein-like isoform X2 [Nilaparvata lugens]|uniref:alpha-tocopherol transfer protein-like isoform X2 n=1 Tax=Nilaparvata lugens TaxID=108931 RepID=UPI00193DA450|nr:alpha-tocopherol transfer protein-like isoform X2 [Nilaparvata lugens]
MTEEKRLLSERSACCESENEKSLEELREAAILSKLVYLNDPKYTDDELEIFYKVEELRQKVLGELEHDIRTDDDFLMRFLRSKHYDVEGAFKKLKNYDSFYRRHLGWKEVHVDVTSHVFGDGVVNVLEHRDALGRRVLWFRSCNWLPHQVSPDQLLQAGALSSELTFLEPSTQRAGLVIIYDMKDFGLSHLRSVTPSFARRMTFFMSECVPQKIESLHVINEPTTFSVLYSLYKRFLDDRVKQRLHFHGADLSSLHEHVPVDILPVELGGSHNHDPKRWLALTEVKSVVRELERLNFRIVSESVEEGCEAEEEEEEEEEEEADLFFI